MRRPALTLAAAALGLLATGCGSGETVSPVPENTVTITTTQAPKGDPAAGKKLFASNGCGSCHTFKPAGSTGEVGPHLDKLAADAKKANRGSVDEYAAESIKDPGAYIVPGFSNAMPSFSQLSDKQVADLVAFLTQS